MILYSFASAKFKKNDKIDFINQYVAIYLLPSKLKTGRDQSLGRPKQGYQNGSVILNCQQTNGFHTNQKRYNQLVCTWISSHNFNGIIIDVKYYYGRWYNEPYSVITVHSDFQYANKRHGWLALIIYGDALQWTLFCSSEFLLASEQWLIKKLIYPLIVRPTLVLAEWKRFHSSSISASLSKPPLQKWNILYWLSLLAITSCPQLALSSEKNSRNDLIAPEITHN